MYIKPHRSSIRPDPLDTTKYLGASSGVIANVHAMASGRFLDAIQAAEYLGGMNSRTLIRWAREGYLPAYPIGEGKRRLWRFREDDLEEWMRDRRTGTLASATDAPTKGSIQ